MKENINNNEHKVQNKFHRKELIALGIYAACYDWANHKKNMGMRIASLYRGHKQYLRKHKLGKFKKCA